MNVDYSKFNQLLEKTAPFLQDYAIPALKQQRFAALEKFLALGFPTHKNEQWKYTDIKGAFAADFTISTHKETDLNIADIIAAQNLPADWNYLVFINGWFAGGKMLEDNFSYGSISALMQQQPEALVNVNLATCSSMQALQQSFFTDGGYFIIPKNSTIDAPLCLLYLSDSSDKNLLISPQTIGIVNEGAKIDVIEVFADSNNNRSSNIINAQTNINCGKNSTVGYYKIQQQQLQCNHVHHINIEAEANSSINSHILTTGGAVSHQNLTINLNAAGANAKATGLYLLQQRQHGDHVININHNAPHCDSEELFRGVLQHRARGIFNGKVLVKKHADKTNAFMSNNSLLLSKTAEADSRPQLEIYAEDVKCNHGATVGSLDKEALFYLQTRGVDEKDAKNLLLHAFANEIVENISNHKVLQHISNIVNSKVEEFSSNEGI